MMDAKNILLIAGGGQNVGKTTLSVRLISHFSSQHDVVGLKISSHLHPISDEAAYVHRGDGFAIVRETNRLLQKDSGKMLDAGAVEVFYIQARPHLLESLVPTILQLVGQRLCVCESGGLRGYVKPGVFLYLTATGRYDKDGGKGLADRVLFDFGFDELPLDVENGGWVLQ